MSDRAAIQAETETNLLRKLLATEEGRFFAHTIIENAGTYGISFADRDAATNYREGRRSIGVQGRALVAEIEPEYLWRMEQEARNREAYYEARADHGED